MTADMQRRIEQLAEQLHAMGFMVTRGNLAEPAAIAKLLGVSEKTLRNWRSELTGPPACLKRGIIWYSIVDFVCYRDAKSKTRDIRVLEFDDAAFQSATTSSEASEAQ